MVTVTNSPTAEHPFRLEQRKSFSFRMRFVNQAGGPLDMTLFQVSLVVKSEYSTTATTLMEIAAAIEDPENGYIRFDIQADDVVASPGEYPYAITLLTPEGYTLLVMKGYMEIVSNTEATWVAEEYSQVNAPLLLNVLFGEGNRLTVQTEHFPPPSLSAAPVQVLPAGSAPSARFLGKYPYQILELGIPLADETVQPEILLLEEDELVPLGTDPGTVVYRLPKARESVKVTHRSSHTGGTISEWELPDDLRIGDVVMALYGSYSAGSSVTWAAPWTEIIDLSQSRMAGAAIYRITDQAALDAIAPPVMTPASNFNSLVLATVRIRAITSAWPAYGSGNGRSAATLQSVTNDGFTINSIGSSPFGSFVDNYAWAVAFSTVATVGGPAPTFDTPAGFTEVFNDTTGGLRFALWHRRYTSLSVPAVPVVVHHSAGLENALYGGCQLVVPAT